MHGLLEALSLTSNSVHSKIVKFESYTDYPQSATNAAKRALIIIVNERKSLIKYLYKTKPEICKKIAEAIGIRGKW